MPSHNPFNLLKEDHKVVAKLFREIENTTEQAEKTRTTLFEELKSALEEHTKIEETLLYPALEEIESTHDITLEAEAEHDVVKNLLEELSGLSPTNEVWTAKITVMKENIEHHVEEEEGEMFPKAEKLMSEEQITALGNGIAEAKGLPDANIDR